jgi:hypothetical protein
LVAQPLPDPCFGPAEDRGGVVAAQLPRQVPPERSTGIRELLADHQVVIQLGGGQRGQAVDGNHQAAAPFGCLEVLGQSQQRCSAKLHGML